MRIFTKTFLTLIIFALCYQGQAQKRYVEPVFDDVEISGLQFAGSNFTILGWIFAALGGQQGNTIRQPLAFQTYTPVGDSETGRPLVIYLHTGNFFPFPQNGSCGGTIADSTNVEIATRLAKMGYVVASADYRLGWLPTHPEELVRRFSLINGAYRGVQDVNTFIRYFKRSVAEGGNPFGIDPNKIVVWGQGTGGYLSLATAYLSEYPEIFATADPSKFLLPTPAGNIPMVIEDYNGNVEGTNDPTFVDANYSAISQLPIGDTLSVPNHVDYDSDFQLAVNMGGALGDSTWVSAGEVPLVSFHVDSDAFAPYTTNVLLVPTATGPQPVVEVSGSYDTQRSVERHGLNDIFKTIDADNDPYGATRGEDFVGLMTFSNTPNDTGAPWEWTDLDTPGLSATDCNSDAAVARTYIDSIVGFFAPRGCVALGLECFGGVSTDDQLDGSYLSITPNPASDFVTLTSAKADIKSYAVYGVDGKVITERDGLNTRTITIERDGLSKGIYFIKASFDEGVITQKIMFN